MLINKLNSHLILLYLIFFFITFNSYIFNNLFFELSDEFFLVYSLVILCIMAFAKLYKFKQVDKIIFFIILYLISQFVNYFLSPFSNSMGFMVLQSIINIKLFIVSYAVFLIWRNTANNIKRIRFFYFSFIVIFMIGFLGNFLLQETWHNMLGHTDIKYRYGFIRIIGWFGGAAQNAYYFSMTLLTLFLLYFKTKKIDPKIFIGKLFLFTIIDFIMAFPLTVRKGMMMVIPYGAVSFSLIKARRKVPFLLVLTFFIGIFLFLIRDTQMMQDTIMNISSMTTADNTYIRGLMIYHGFSLFSEFFPLGVGSGTFGTVISNYNTLEVYHYVGIDLSWLVNVDGTLKGVYDSGLASFFAESGFIGVVAAFFIIYYFFKFNKKKLDEYNYLIFKILTWFALLLSITEPVCQNGMFTVFYVMNMLFIYSKNHCYK